MKTIHLPLTEIQKMASLVLFAEDKGFTPFMSGVNIRVQTDRITAVATDRYAIGHYEFAGNFGLDNGTNSDYVLLSKPTCKALLAIKRGRHEIDTCLVTYGDNAFSVEYAGITYKGEALADLEAKFEQVVSYVGKPVDESFSGFALNPTHLTKLAKISKNHWRFDRYSTGTTNQKLAPVSATCDGFAVVIQPVIER